MTNLESNSASNVPFCLFENNSISSVNKFFMNIGRLGKNLAEARTSTTNMQGVKADALSQISIGFEYCTAAINDFNFVHTHRRFST